MGMHLVTSIKDKLNLVLQVRITTFQIPTIASKNTYGEMKCMNWSAVGKGKLRMKCFPVITFFSALEINVLELMLSLRTYAYLQGHLLLTLAAAEEAVGPSEVEHHWHSSENTV